MVRLVPSDVANAEAFFLVTRRRCQVDSGAVIQRFFRIIPPQIREETADANAGNSAGVIDGGGRAHKIERNTSIQTKVTRKVVSQSGSHVVNAAVVAVAALELGSQCPARGEASGVVFCGPGGGGVRWLREQGGAHE